jgi:hypothetical protein
VFGAGVPGAPACATFVVSVFGVSFELQAHNVVARATATVPTNRDMGPLWVAG